MFFKCKHPFKDLVVRKAATIEKVDASFKCITYHFLCNKCDKDLDKTYVHLIGGATAFLNRKKEI